MNFRSGGGLIFVIEFFYNEARISAQAEFMGCDLCVRICGGDVPHIGSVSIAEPRESLDGSGKGATTVSTYSYVGHKDYFVSNCVAEELSAELQSRVVVICGIHYDNITPEQVDSVMVLAKQIAADILHWNAEYDTHK